MDYNEVVKGFKYRHPWELSRTKCVHKVWNKYYPKSNGSEKVRYINIGAGDCFFDEMLVKELGFELSAVDIAYPETVENSTNVVRYNDLGKVDGPFSFGIMMDSLEYMDDDIEYVRNLSAMISDGGYIFLTLPAHKILFNNHDVLVGNKRRYDRKDIVRIDKEIEEVSLVEIKSFYWSLCIIRKIQKLFNKKADEKVTTGWNHSSKSILTKLFVSLLDFDFATSKLFKNAGLSWLVVFKVQHKK